MHNEFTPIIERDGDWYVAYCPELPGANGQGRSRNEVRASLAEAIALIWEEPAHDPSPDSAGRSTPLIARTKRSQREVSATSLRRPAGVRR
jgi:predicted RNase H-like HicB family nuclease